MEKEENSQRDYYVEGNAVRRMEAVPDYRRRRQEHIDQENEAQERRRRRMVRREQEKALRVNRSYLVFLTVAVTIFGVFAGTYIKIQSDMTARMSSVANLESQLSDLKADNDEAYKRLSTSTDLDNIKNTALNELGMGYARESQIIYYSVGDDDYMDQYGSIPEK
jgi:cell division protein FtsL